MENLPDDLQKFILSFLSLTDKINAIQTAKFFYRNINKISILTHKIYTLTERNNILITNNVSHLSLISNYIYVQYYTGRPSRIHPLFSRDYQKNQCIVLNCREKKLENIYIQLPHLNNHQYYIKRKIPYCLQCFNIWH